MKRLGMYSGRIYKENEIKDMEECGLMISDEQANDKEWIANRHSEHIGQCSNCFGCPLKQRDYPYLWGVVHG